MPNWCKGNLRLRGTGTAILDFVKNEIEIVGHAGGFYDGTRCCAPEIVDEYGDVNVKVPEQANGWMFPKMYIKGTRRNFIDVNEFFFYLGDEDDRADVLTVCIDDVSAAWGFFAEPYVDKAKRYGLDIKIVGFEKGMQFMQIIEIVNGELIKDQEIKFDDWDWECLMPNMGG